MRLRSQQEEGDREDWERRGEEEEDERSHFHQSGMEAGRENLAQRRYNRYGREYYSSYQEDFFPRVSQSVLSLPDVCSSQAAQCRMAPKRCLTPGGSTSDKMTPKTSVDKLPARPSPHSQLHMNLPSVMVVPPLLTLPPLVDLSNSVLQAHSQVPPPKSRSMVFLPHPPSSSPSSFSFPASVRPALLPLLTHASSVTSLVCCSSQTGWSRRSVRRHSVQLENIRGGEEMNLSDM